MIRILRFLRIHRALLLAVVAGLAGGAAAQSFRERQAAPQFAPTVIRAHSFQLVDDNGGKRAEIGFDKSGIPHITLYDSSGRVIWSTSVRALPVTR